MKCTNSFNPLGAKLTKWPNTLTQVVRNLPTNCLSVFGHFVGLALKGLIAEAVVQKCSLKKVFLKISQISQKSSYVAASFYYGCIPVKLTKFLSTSFST